MSRPRGFSMPPDPVQPHDEAAILSLIEDIYRQLGYTDPRPALITEADLASILRMKVPTLQCRRSSGKPMPPHTRAGRGVLYRPRDVAAYILSSTEGDHQ